MASQQAHDFAEQFLCQRLIIKEHVAQIRGDALWQRLPERPVSFIGGDLAIGIDIDSAGDGWVRTDRDLSIRYRAGIGSSEDQLPLPILEALKRYDQHLEEGGPADAPPAAVTALLRPYRRRSVPDVATGVA